MNISVIGYTIRKPMIETHFSEIQNNVSKMNIIAVNKLPAQTYQLYYPSSHLFPLSNDTKSSLFHSETQKKE